MLSEWELISAVVLQRRASVCSRLWTGIVPSSSAKHSQQTSASHSLGLIWQLRFSWQTQHLSLKTGLNRMGVMTGLPPAPVTRSESVNNCTARKIVYRTVNGNNVAQTALTKCADGYFRVRWKIVTTTIVTTIPYEEKFIQVGHYLLYVFQTKKNFVNFLHVLDRKMYSLLSLQRDNSRLNFSSVIYAPSCCLKLEPIQRKSIEFGKTLKWCDGD